MSQWLSELAALAEASVHSSVPTWQLTTIWDARGFNSLFWSSRYACGATVTQKNKNKFTHTHRFSVPVFRGITCQHNQRGRRVPAAWGLLFIF